MGGTKMKSGGYMYPVYPVVATPLSIGLFTNIINMFIKGEFGVCDNA